MDEVARAYDEVADLYVEAFGDTSRVHPHDLFLIEQYLANGTGPVLDVGCGPGHLAAHLAAHGVTAIGIDVTEVFVRHARATHDATVSLGDASHLPVRTGSVSGLLAWYSLIHLVPPLIDPTLTELRRVAGADAVLVVGLFDADEVTEFDHKVTAARAWPVQEFSERLRRAGFVEIERNQRPPDPSSGTRAHASIVAIARS